MISDKTKDIFRALDGMLDEFSQLDRHTRLQAVRAFLLAARYPGEGSTELAKRMAVPQNTMSRYMLDLGDRKRNGEPGLGLVTTELDPAADDLRTHPVRLTPKGRALAERLYTHIRKLGFNEYWAGSFPGQED